MADKESAPRCDREASRSDLPLRPLPSTVMEPLADNVESFLRAVDRTAWAEVARRGRGDELERSIKSLAKTVSQAAVQSVDDRRQRQQSRTEVYNTLVPLLRQIGDRDVDVRRGARYAVLGLAAGLLISGGVTGLLIF